MEQKQLVPPSSFCWNKKCSDYGQVKPENIRKFGKTAKGTQRRQCKTCKKTFVDTIGTVFYGRQHDEQTIVECLAMLADRNSLAAIERIKGVKTETVSDWLVVAAQHVEQTEALLLANYQLSRAQLDALWTYVGHKGEKGGSWKKMNKAPFGGGPPLRSIRAYG